MDSNTAKLVPSPAKTNPGGPLFFLLATLIIQVLYIQFGILNKLSNTVSVFYRWGTLENFINWYLTNGRYVFNVTDYIVLLSFFLTLGILLIIEFRYKLLTQVLFNKIFISDNKTFLLLVGFSLLILRYYLAPGDDVYRGDSPWHLLKGKMVFELLRNGEFPFWHNFTSQGTRFLQTYSPMVGFVPGIANLLINNALVTSKLTLMLLHFIAGIATYAWARQIFKRREFAFFAALGSLLIYHHSHYVIIGGRYSMAYVMAFLPLVFFSIELLFNTRNTKTLVPLGLSISLVVLSNMGMGLWTFIFAALYFLLKLVVGREPTAQRVRLLVIFGLGNVLALVICSYLILFTLQRLGGYATSGNLVTPSFSQLLVWNNFRFGINFLYKEKYWTVGYLGISLFVLSLIGYLATKTKEGKRDFLVFGILYPFFWVIPFIPEFSTTLALKIPFYSFSHPVRYLVFLVTLLPVMACFGLKIIWARWPQKSIFTLIIILTLIDLGSTTFVDHNSPIQPAEKKILQWFKEKFGSKNGKLAPFVVTLGYKGRGFFVPDHLLLNNQKFVAETGIPTNIITDTNFPPKTKRFLDSVVFKFRDNFYESKEKMRESLDGLFFTNSRFVIKNNTKFDYRGITGIKQIFQVSAKYVIIELDHSPYIWSTRISALDKTDSLLPMQSVQLMGLDRASRKAHTLVVDKADFKSMELPSPGAQLSLDSHEVYDQEIKLKIETSEPCFVRLPYEDDPELIVMLNGNVIKPITSYWGFMVLKLEKGKNEIHIKFSMPFRKKAMILFSLTIFLGTILLCLGLYKKALVGRLTGFYQEMRKSFST